MRSRAGFVVALTGGILLILSLSAMDWVRFSGNVGGSPRRSYGLRFLEMGDHLSIVDIGIAGAYFGGIGLLLAAVAGIVALVGTWSGDRRRTLRGAAAALALAGALLQIVVMSAIGSPEGGAGPGTGAFIGLVGYALLGVGVAIGPPRR